MMMMMMMMMMKMMMMMMMMMIMSMMMMRMMMKGKTYLEIGVASGHKHLRGLWLVCTVMHINIKFGGLQTIYDQDGVMIMKSC